MSNTIINSEVHGAYFEAIKEDVKKHIYIYIWKLGARENQMAFNKLQQKKDHIFVPLNQVLMKKRLYYMISNGLICRLRDSLSCS